MPIPEIPQETLEVWKSGFNDPSKIKWLKSVTDDGEIDGRIDRNSPTYSNAYLTTGKDFITGKEKKDPRVIKNDYGVFFCLQFNQRFENSILDAKKGDIILISQNLVVGQTKEGNDKCERRFTHLVTPINNEYDRKPYPELDPNCWPGRWVKVIAMGSNTLIGSIPLKHKDNPNSRNYPYSNGKFYSITGYCENCPVLDFQKYILNVAFKYNKDETKWGI